MSASGKSGVVIFISVLLVAAAAVVLSPSLLTPVAGDWLGGRSPAVDELKVSSKQMHFGVDATGVLKATSVQYFGAPPEFGGYWEFQIVSLIAEGKNVKKGDVLVTFDAQKIRDDLQRFQNELDQATKEMERSRAQIDLEKQELNATLADAQARYEKMKAKQEGVSPDLRAYQDIELDRLSLEQLRREVEALRERIRWHETASDATYKIIASKKARAENKVAEITKGMEGFAIKADRDGIIILRLKWNNERYQVGETCYSGQPLMQIPDLNTILVEAYVPEVDIGKVKLGQKAEVTLDALPGRSFQGTVQSIGTLVRTKAWDQPNKVLEVQIVLATVDPAVMRPAMTVRARIETASYDGVLAIPLRAVRKVAGKPTVRTKVGSAWTDRNIELGESNGVEVIVKRGLAPGDRIAAAYRMVEAGSSK